MMNYEIFKEVVKEKFMDYMPDSFKGMELIVRPAEKVNMTYDAINIRGEDTTISPTIYINDMYEKYQSCGDLEETLMAACDLMAMEFAKTPQVVDVDSLYKDADEKVVFQLINTEQNKSFLEQVPHREFQDLSIIYKLVVNADTESIQSIKVTNSLAERLGMNEEQLFKYAAENTRRILPPRIRNMNDVMKEMFLSDGMPEEIAEMMIREVPPEQTLWIISNNRGIDGAVSMLYENELHELAENLESDLYILPSSVHEVLAVSTELTEPEELAQMVAEVNMQKVALEERLSNQVYHYDNAGLYSKEDKTQLVAYMRTNGGEKPVRNPEREKPKWEDTITNRMMHWSYTAEQKEEVKKALAAGVPKATILTYFYPEVTVEKMSSYRKEQ